MKDFYYVKTFERFSIKRSPSIGLLVLVGLYCRKASRVLLCKFNLMVTRDVHSNDFRNHLGYGRPLQKLNDFQTKRKKIRSNSGAIVLFRNLSHKIIENIVYRIRGP